MDEQRGDCRQQSTKCLDSLEMISADICRRKVCVLVLLQTHGTLATVNRVTCPRQMTQDNVLQQLLIARKVSLPAPSRTLC